MVRTRQTRSGGAFTSIVLSIRLSSSVNHYATSRLHNTQTGSGVPLDRPVNGVSMVRARSALGWPVDATERVELLQGTLDLIVLRALSTMGPQHAYGLTARLEQVADHPLELNQGTLYPALVRLEQQGLIKGTWQKTENNRDAKYYAITKAGLRALDKQTARWRRLAGLVDKLLLGGVASSAGLQACRRRFVSRLVNAFSPGRAEDDLARETAAHLALLEDDLRRRGMTADEARASPRRRAFGGVEQMKDRQRDARSFVWLDDARRDLRHAARLLRRDPLFTLTAVLSLAIGIGANTTIFTVANAVLFRPPAGVADPDRLVDIGTRTPGGGFGNSSYPNYLDLRARTTTLDGVYAYSLFPRAMSLGAESGTPGTERIFGTLVTANYFACPRRRAGRWPPVQLAEAESDEADAVVLSHRFWTRRFNGDPGIVGRTMTLNGRSVTVIGVASEGFQGTGIRAGDAWVPLTAAASASSLSRSRVSLAAARRPLEAGRLRAAGRRGSGRDRPRARRSSIPIENRGLGLRVQRLSPVPGSSAPVAVFLALLMSIVALVLVIACANLAGVLLARASARRQEIAVRLAMGAGRSRLVRQLLAETLMLFALGGVAGLLLARGLTSVLVAALPALPFPVNVSLALDAARRPLHGGARVRGGAALGSRPGASGVEGRRRVRR